MGAFSGVVGDITAPLGGLGATVAQHVTESAELFAKIPEELLRNIDPATGMISKQYLKLGGGLDVFMAGLGNVPQEVRDHVKKTITLLQDEENLTRMEVVGQNGNTGIHYEEIKEKTT